MTALIGCEGENVPHLVSVSAADKLAVALIHSTVHSRFPELTAIRIYYSALVLGIRRRTRENLLSIWNLVE